MLVGSRRETRWKPRLLSDHIPTRQNELAATGLSVMVDMGED
jgi:hypothetical protein